MGTIKNCHKGLSSFTGQVGGVAVVENEGKALKKEVEKENMSSPYGPAIVWGQIETIRLLWGGG